MKSYTMVSNISSYNPPISQNRIIYASKFAKIMCMKRPASNRQSLEKAPRTRAGIYGVKFRTLEGCRLGISWYPDFEYDARGGSGSGVGQEEEIGSDDEDGVVSVTTFDVETLYVPPLTGVTTKFLGLPLPPFLRIDIAPEVLQGRINRRSGRVDLLFRSKFVFSIGSAYRAPPLLVETTLTSEESKGSIRAGKGERMDGDGRCKLVGVAVVDPIDDVLMNSFLGLPTECIAYLNATIAFTDPS
ncbi:uncharacterized protein LOC109707334 [Ananas comosus]